MTVDSIRYLVGKKAFRIVLALILAAAAILYFKAFFTTGIFYNGTFLKKEILLNETHYTGKDKQGDIKITVLGKADYDKESEAKVTFSLPNNVVKSYRVYLNRIDKWAQGSVKIEDEKNNTIFEGRYIKGSLLLYDKDSNPVFDIRLLTDTEEIYSDEYEVPKKTIVSLSLNEDEEIRGNVHLLVLALILIAITAVDMKYPLFFFELRHGFEVESPQPSDFYLTMQKVEWVAYPVIAVIILIISIG